jgi:hypothetical protein
MQGRDSGMNYADSHCLCLRDKVALTLAEQRAAR